MTTRFDYCFGTHANGKWFVLCSRELPLDPYDGQDGDLMLLQFRVSEEHFELVEPTFPRDILYDDRARILGLDMSHLCLYKDATYSGGDGQDHRGSAYDYKVWDVNDMTNVKRKKLAGGNSCECAFVESGLLFTLTSSHKINVVEELSGTHVVTFELHRSLQ
ncbi:hypothetical protein Pelo_5054 [Pelomyxa schiedti]|nr:hypothetical protein Pelo_5054 [Pelomyxa schiedti]